MSDLISRQDAVDALSHMCSEDENGITVSRANVDSMLKALPSVQPDRKPGRWIRVSADKHVRAANYVYQCSECGNNTIGVSKHCPNCGVKMEDNT